MPIKIEITGDDAYHAQMQMIEILRGSQNFPRADHYAPPPDTTNISHIHLMPDAPEPVSVLEEPEVKAAIAKRERGQPAPGRKRRTKEEIAEDEAAEKAEAGPFGEEAPTATSSPEPIAATVNQISTTEISTEAGAAGAHGPSEEPEVAAQDAADEKAEAEAAQGETLTHDNLRQVMGAYVKTYGMPAAQEDGPEIFEKSLGTPPAGEKSWKVSLVPDDQSVLMKAVHAWSEAVESNPFDRKAVA